MPGSSPAGSVFGQCRGQGQSREKSPPGASWEERLELPGQKVFIPNMCDDALAIAAGFRSEGIDSVVLDEPDAENIRLGRRYTSGKEFTR